MFLVTIKHRNNIHTFRGDSSPLESSTSPRPTSTIKSLNLDPESPTSYPESQPQSAASPAALPPPKQPSICHSDVGAFVDSSCSDSDKYRVTEEHFVTEPSYKYPKASNGRSFQQSWLVKYQWLCYSQRDDGGYCLPCVLFFIPILTFRSDPGVLVAKPLTNFQKALEILSKHHNKQFHRSSVIQME